MSTQATTARPIQLTGALLTAVPLSVAVALPWLAGLSLYPSALMLGTLGFLAYRIFVVRLGLCHHHRRGILLVQRGRFEEGLESFRQSERVWAARPFLDRYRAVLLGCATPYRFRTLARYNQAYAFSRLGRGGEALTLLSSVLAEDPSMLMARELRDVLLAGSALHPDVGKAMQE